MAGLIITEKPAVARAIAEALGSYLNGKGFFEVADFLVSWSFGHLLQLGEPQQQDELWQKWEISSLPMVPQVWRLVEKEGCRDQLETLRQLSDRHDINYLICATDAGREGELIFAYIKEWLNCTKPVKRLWISSLTQKAIIDGLRDLRLESEFQGLRNAAKQRACADWLIGMNCSRLYSLKFADSFHVGRVQTPTLAMVASRDREIDRFVPVAEFRVKASLELFNSQKDGFLVVASEGNSWTSKGFPDRRVAQEAIRNLEAGIPRVAEVLLNEEDISPPLPYDLASIQKEANQLFGYTAFETLDALQELYESHRLITYPRVATHYLTADLVETLPEIARRLSSFFPDVHQCDWQDTGNFRCIESIPSSDHHGIIPTGLTTSITSLSGKKAHLFELIAKRFLVQWLPSATKRSIRVAVKYFDKFEQVPQLLQSELGTVVIDEEYCDHLWHPAPNSAGGFSSQIAPAATDFNECWRQALEVKNSAGPAAEKIEVRSIAFELQKKVTRPPLPYTDGTLISAMESPGSLGDLDTEKENSHFRCGIGTPATRAQVIESLIERGYVRRQGRFLSSTEKGRYIDASVDPDLKSIGLTAQFESSLREIELSQEDNGISSLTDQAAQLVTRIVANEGHGLKSDIHYLPKVSGQNWQGMHLDSILRNVFGYQKFRQHQEEVCEAAVEGRDLLLVMPTGAGKSICYQLPGLARGGRLLSSVP